MEASLSFPDDEAECWFVLRDLKRSNARHPAYRQLAEIGLRVFTPMHEVVTLVRGQRVRKDVPFLRDLLFVRERYSELRSVVERDPTLQFRYVRGGYCIPMTVRTAEMECFIRAVESTFRPRYYLPGEISPSMIGRQVLIVGGPLNGYEGHLPVYPRQPCETPVHRPSRTVIGRSGSKSRVHSDCCNSRKTPDS